MRTVVDVDADAELRCEWDPLIPFPGARLSQRYDLRLATGSALYWSDAFMSGREGRGERWAFGTLEHELALSCAGTLAYLERYLLEPRTHPPTAAWVASDCCYFGTVLVVPGRVLQAPDRLQQELSSFVGLRAAVDTLDPAPTLVRLMARSGTAFHEARALVRCRLCA
jgi:urease accessory protein UreH